MNKKPLVEAGTSRYCIVSFDYAEFRALLDQFVTNTIPQCIRVEHLAFGGFVEPLDPPYLIGEHGPVAVIPNSK